MNDYDLHTLPNGLRIVHKQIPNTRVAHCGFVLDVGSRDEQAHQQGLAHFWEHMAFKGTQRRKAFHIINRLESVGGELNAYTTKEKICFYASFLDTHYDKAAELLTDITFDSIFPPKEIDKERGVILEEMSMYVDSPDEAIYDEFEEVVFANHPLGNNILGTSESVRRFGRDDFRAFLQEHLNTERIIFASVGNLPMAQVVRRMRKWLAAVPRLSGGRPRRSFAGYAPARRSQRRAIHQSHCLLGVPAFPLGDPRQLPFFLLTNLLGGPGLNSRLNLALREKYGFVYSVEANYTPYTDTGLFSIYFATEPGQRERSLSLVHKELRRLREMPLGTVQLHHAKEQLMGQMAMAEERNLSLMLALGQRLLDLERMPSLAEVFNHIQRITAPDLQDLANEVFDADRFSQLDYLPEA